MGRCSTWLVPALGSVCEYREKQAEYNGQVAIAMRYYAMLGAHILYFLLQT